MTCIEGHLVHGMGLAKDLTRIDWVRRQLIEHVGIDPYPGTLNLNLHDDTNRARWRNWCRMPGNIIAPEEVEFCRARCFTVRVAGRIPAAVLLPESADYRVVNRFKTKATNINRRSSTYQTGVSGWKLGSCIVL